MYEAIVFGFIDGDGVLTLALIGFHLSGVLEHHAHSGLSSCTMFMRS
jgi:hypothetical protein